MAAIMAATSMISDDERRTIYYSFTKLVDVLLRSLRRVSRSSFMSLSEVLTRSVGRYGQYEHAFSLFALRAFSRLLLPFFRLDLARSNRLGLMLPKRATLQSVVKSGRKETNSLVVAVHAVVPGSPHMVTLAAFPTEKAASVLG
jgi:hypothetical protein